jgi:hypothetical protein
VLIEEAVTEAQAITSAHAAEAAAATMGTAAHLNPPAGARCLSERLCSPFYTLLKGSQRSGL